MQGEGGGPRTAAGKTTVARNALKHGLTATTPVVPGLEDPAHWQRHLDGMLESLQPEGYHEQVLAERIALILWKTRRCLVYELALIAHSQETAEENLQVAEAYGRRTLAQDLSRGTLPAVPEAAILNARARMLLPRDPELSRILKYEATLHRQYIQLLHELEAMQARRHGERTPLARLDISGPPA